MNNDLLGGFIDKKKADSAFLTIEDGESAVIKQVREMKMITKTGFGGEEKEVIRLICDVATPAGLKIKNFDNGTQRFAQEMQDKGVIVGCGFTLSRQGAQTKTRYTISNVVNGAAPSQPDVPFESAPAPVATPAAEPAPAAVTPPAEGGTA